MGTYPTSPRAAFIEWAVNHGDLFVGNAAQIGLTAAQATAFKNDAMTAQAADRDLSVVRQSARTATNIANDATSALRSRARATIGLIKAFAESTNNPQVYNLAEIPPPADPTTLPPPGQPTDLNVVLDPTSGALSISWKAQNPVGASGTSYIIRRRTSMAGTFEFIGVTGTRKFVDSTFLAGPDMVQYTVQGQRSDSAGPVSQILTINFGRVMGAGAGGLGGGQFAITGTSIDDGDQQHTRIAA